VPRYRRWFGDGPPRTDVHAAAARRWCLNAGLEWRESRRFMDPALALATRRGWVLDPERLDRLVPRTTRWTPPWWRLNRVHVAVRPSDGA
ncbi:MAG: hypothetical protein KDA28_02160, partial [Phycisphaerales bacterium]|nr:hypothetical protein [Phycisphaerales bacterium]